MERVPGIDVSRWQGTMDWQKVAEAGYRFAVIRATIGDYYSDPRFFTNWSEAREAGLLLSSYHVITPNVSADAQIGRFFEVLGKRRPDLPLVLDVERTDGMSPQVITQRIRECLDGIEAGAGRKPIIYTARWFWDRSVLPSSQWSTYDLWVASYTRNPILPRDWQSWLIWQYSESGTVPGSGSRHTDLNWFAGSYEDLLHYAGRADEPPPHEARWHVRVVVPKLNVRNGPGRQYDNIGDLYEGDILELLTLTGDDVWVEFEPGKWAAFSLKGDPYLRLEIL